jgi:transketolase
MPWTAEYQTEAETKASEFQQEYATALDAWRSSLLAGTGSGTSSAIVQDVVYRWQGFVNTLQANSSAILSNENTMESLGILASQISEEKATLARLRNQAVTRWDQADSVNPKIRGSPYTNILGLRRTFRESTRFGLLMASVAFGVGALSAVGIFVADVFVAGRPVLPENEFKVGH